MHCYEFSGSVTKHPSYMVGKNNLENYTYHINPAHLQHPLAQSEGYQYAVVLTDSYSDLEYVWHYWMKTTKDETFATTQAARGGSP